LDSNPITIDKDDNLESKLDSMCAMKMTNIKYSF
jgi:hypothetical protein